LDVAVIGCLLISSHLRTPGVRFRRTINSGDIDRGSTGIPGDGREMGGRRLSKRRLLGYQSDFGCGADLIWSEQVGFHQAATEETEEVVGGQATFQPFAAEAQLVRLPGLLPLHAA